MSPKERLTESEQGLLEARRLWLQEAGLRYRTLKVHLGRCVRCTALQRVSRSPKLTDPDAFCGVGRRAWLLWVQAQEKGAQMTIEVS